MSYWEESQNRPPLVEAAGELAVSTSMVCRDFLRNVCKRGSHCRYYHPPPEYAVVFCHDFQNAGCRRPGCRFVHATREEEEEFRRTGHLPSTSGGGGVDPLTAMMEVPVCKDFQKGECRRGMKCKYEHLLDSTVATTESTTEITSATAVKIRKTEVTSSDGDLELVSLADYRAIQEENRVLRRDIEELRRTVGVLVATNEMLLEQNAKYRNSVAPVANQMIATPAVPAVIASSSGVATLSHIAIDGNSGGLVVTQQPATPASVGTLHPCVSGAATYHPVMTAATRLQPLATATLHPVATATLHPSATATLHPVVTGSIVSSQVAMETSPVSVAIGVPSHAIVPVTLAVATVQTASVAQSLTTTSHIHTAPTFVSYPVMSQSYSVTSRIA